LHALYFGTISFEPGHDYFLYCSIQWPEFTSYATRMSNDHEIYMGNKLERKESYLFHY
jgi:hypothetical protein